MLNVTHVFIKQFIYILFINIDSTSIDKKKCLVKQIPYLFLQLNVSVKQFLLLNNPSYLFKQSMYINFMTLIITLYCTGKNIIITSLTLPFYSYSGTINDLLLVISRVGNFLPRLRRRSQEVI